MAVDWPEQIYRELLTGRVAAFQVEPLPARTSRSNGHDVVPHHERERDGSVVGAGAAG